MTSEAVLAQGRAAARAYMVDRCAIVRPSGLKVTDPETGVVSDVPGVTLYEGACRVQIESAIETQADAGEARYQLLTVVVSVPVDATVYAQGDLVTVTAATHDPALVGREYRVQAVVSKSHATARRLRCEEGV